MQKGDFGAEGREGAGAVRLGGWCEGRGRRWRCSPWEDGARGRGRRWRCSPWKLYVFILKVCGSNDLGVEQCTTAREPGGSFAVRAIALSK